MVPIAASQLTTSRHNRSTSILHCFIHLLSAAAWALRAHVLRFLTEQGSMALNCSARSARTACRSTGVPQHHIPPIFTQPPANLCPLCIPLRCCLNVSTRVGTAMRGFTRHFWKGCVVSGAIGTALRRVLGWITMSPRHIYSRRVYLFHSSSPAHNHWLSASIAHTCLSAFNTLVHDAHRTRREE